jgi:DNA-binding NarL/FixJ family response regulator
MLKPHVLLAPLAVAALSAALDALDVPAFLVRADGDITFANAPGLVLRDRDPDGLSHTLRAEMGTEGDGLFSFTKVSAEGAPTHWLAIQRRGRADPLPCVSRMAARYRLTPRQAEVLALLVRGLSNKAISGALACAESTVELHVSQLLHKTASDGRAHLVAKFWADCAA